MRLKLLEILLATRALCVSVFPRVATNSLSQAVYLLHASLGHMPRNAMIALAKSVIEEHRNSDTLSSMVVNWPTALTPEVYISRTNQRSLSSVQSVCFILSRKN